MAHVQVKLLAFAQAQDELGYREKVIECSPDETAHAVLSRIAPGLKLDVMRVAVDCEYRSWDEPIGNASEIALIPPVSGG